MNPEGTGSRRPLLLLVGGGTGLVGRALLEELGPDHQIRSVHRAPSARELSLGIDCIRADVTLVRDWGPILEDVDIVVNVAWYRQGSDRRFRPLAEGLTRLIKAAEARRIHRFVQLSVPTAPPDIEAHLPYMVRKREVDRALAESQLDFSIICPTMLYGPGDKLLTVLLRTAARWHRLPMFGDGQYHVSPLAVRDLARIVRRELSFGGRTSVRAGGPVAWKYRDLTDLVFTAIQRPPRYLQLTPRGGMRLARLLEVFGSSLLYPYEVEWLVSDRLGLPPYVGLDRPLEHVEVFVREEAQRLAPARRGSGGHEPPRVRG